MVRIGASARQAVLLRWDFQFFKARAVLMVSTYSYRMLSSVPMMMSFLYRIVSCEFFFMLHIPKPHAAMWAQAPGI